MLHVGRQPIYGRDRGLVGYELLYRTAGAERAVFTDGDRASLSVMLAAFVEIGLPRLTSGRTAYINLTRNGILCEFPRIFPKEGVVFEILEDVAGDADVMQALARMASDGHVFALDDFCESASNRVLLPWVRILKLDVQALSDAELAYHARAHAHRELIAEKVETREQHERCLELGIGAFQGYWLAAPKTLSCEVTPVSRSTVLSLLMLLNGKARPSPASLAAVLATDPSMLLRVLRAVPADYAHGVATVAEAVHAVGTERLASICTMLVLATESEEPAPPPEGVMACARLAEILGGLSSRSGAEEALFAGLLLAATPHTGSRFEMLSTLPLAAVTRDAVIGRSGDLAAILDSAARFCATALSADQSEPIAALVRDAHHRVQSARDLLLA
jgi:EAL and modified HD-GYP domain-containing signal transduction protein